MPTYINRRNSAAIIRHARPIEGAASRRGKKSRKVALVFSRGSETPIDPDPRKNPRIISLPAAQ